MLYQLRRCGAMREVREPIDGGWYPADRAALEATLRAFLDAAHEERPPGEVVGLVVPHAGYVYSGHVAARAYGCIGGESYGTVVIVSPSHYHGGGAVLTTRQRAFLTPLGVVDVDGEVLERIGAGLSGRLGEGVVEVYDTVEHAIEVQLPFLQYLLEGFRIVPLMVYEQTVDVALGLGASIAEAVEGRRVLLVASSDLSHYYPLVLAERYDRRMLARIESMDPRAVIEAESEGVGYACGRAAVGAVLEAARLLGADAARVLAYDTSASATGDRSAVVGYGSVILVRSTRSRPCSA